MTQFPPQLPPHTRAQHYVHVLSHTCGITVVAEGPHRLLWLSIAGKLQFHQCNSTQDLLDLLQHPSIVTPIKTEWLLTPDPSITFGQAYADVLANIQAHCQQFPDTQSPHTPIINQRIRNQLLWSFTPDGALDPEIFLTILIYENVWLNNTDLMQLVSEITQTRHALQLK